MRIIRQVFGTHDRRERQARRLAARQEFGLATCRRIAAARPGSNRSRAPTRALLVARAASAAQSSKPNSRQNRAHCTSLTTPTNTWSPPSDLEHVVDGPGRHPHRHRLRCLAGHRLLRHVPGRPGRPLSRTGSSRPPDPSPCDGVVPARPGRRSRRTSRRSHRSPTRPRAKAVPAVRSCRPGRPSSAQPRQGLCDARRAPAGSPWPSSRSAAGWRASSLHSPTPGDRARPGGSFRSARRPRPPAGARRQGRLHS